MTPSPEPSSARNTGQNQQQSSSNPGAKRKIISFNCKGCECRYHVPAQLGGRTVRCKKCDTFTVIPMVSDPPIVHDDSSASL